MTQRTRRFATYIDQRKKQIPGGNDRKKSKTNGKKSKGVGRSGSGFTLGGGLGELLFEEVHEGGFFGAEGVGLRVGGGLEIGEERGHGAG